MASSKLEYLKRYMSKEDNNDSSVKKKKKKKRTKDPGGFKIIDASMQGTDKHEKDPKLLKSKKYSQDLSDEEENFALLEEKPQIAAEFDERPALMTGKWKKMTGNINKSETLDYYTNSTIQSSNDNSKCDTSPPRRRRHDSSSENERKPSKRRHDSSSDESSTRVRKRHDSFSDDNQKNKSINTDSDASPPRRKNLSNRESDSDFSPPRKNRNNKTNVPSDSDNSPPRSRLEKNISDSDNSPPRVRKNRRQSDSDNSPPRTKNNSNLASKTLDGKKAGLQNANSLKSEMDKLRNEERNRLTALSSEISGKGAKTMVRGRLKEKQAEEERKKAEAEIPDAVKEKYSRWSKGLKQMDNDRRKIDHDLHEMGKSFARSAEDEDMNEKLKAEERAEDPMLAYMQSKRKKAIKSSGVMQYPEYKGPPPPPNRFGIKPGYRWDGVDRSTGFEKRLFEHSNKRKAVAEEAYKWSTEDM